MLAFKFLYTSCAFAFAVAAPLRLDSALKGQTSSSVATGSLNSNEDSSRRGSENKNNSIERRPGSIEPIEKAHTKILSSRSGDMGGGVTDGNGMEWISELSVGTLTNIGTPITMFSVWLRSPDWLQWGWVTKFWKSNQ
ncbi:hypothetical protein BDY19DRAFT_903552 [Irpex rosettiformis]|uniref:Uncharacterized protein n=1 Tax=Irpex rosettiformis TaxID=378272 RepID=A0ACB8UEQ7_9APHY|nr:hypothetical protein BDY19DRAFT_903552 [Irpex rosettiformis]